MFFFLTYIYSGRTYTRFRSFHIFVLLHLHIGSHGSDENIMTAVDAILLRYHTTYAETAEEHKQIHQLSPNQLQKFHLSGKLHFHHHLSRLTLLRPPNLAQASLARQGQTDKPILAEPKLAQSKNVISYSWT